MSSTAVKTFQAIRSHAESIKNDEQQHISDAVSEWDTWPQGDVYLTYLGDEVPSGATVAKVQDPQLAPGTTQGSRHTLDSLKGITLYERDSNELVGPVIKSDRRFNITHPEHGNVSCPPGVWGVTYQRTMAEEIRRVQD